MFCLCSFLLGKLREEMKIFTRDWVIEPTLKHSVLLLIVILHLAVIAGVLAWVMAYTLADTGQWSTLVGVTAATILFVLSYMCLIGMWQASKKLDWEKLYQVNVYLAGRFNALKLLLEVMFSHPPGKAHFEKTLFCDHSKCQKWLGIVQK